MTEPWLRLDGITCVTDVPPPIVMPRWFRRRPRPAPEVIFEHVDLHVAAGVTVVVGPAKATQAFAAVASGVRHPFRGAVRSSTRVVGVLRRRARLIVDMRVRRAIVREARLRGVPTDVAKAIVDDVAAIAGILPTVWTSELGHDEYSRIAPAVAVACDAPIVVLDGVLTGRSPEFEDRLLARLSARAADGLATVICVPDLRLAEAVTRIWPGTLIVELATALSVQDHAPDEGFDDDLEEEADEELDLFSADRRFIDASPIHRRPTESMLVHDLRVEQDGVDAKAVDGAEPFSLIVDVIVLRHGPGHWQLRLVRRATGTVLVAGDTTESPVGGSGSLRVEVPAGLPRGRHELHLRHEMELDGELYVTGGVPIAHVRCRGGLPVPERVKTAVVSWVR